MVTTATPFMIDYLEGVRSGVADAVAATLPEGGPRGNLYEPLAEFVGRSGKSLRPALCIAAARAHGSTTGRALPSAVALELLHNAFLIHDDVEDGSVSRRGFPTMHTEHGVPIAVNVGDGLAALALQPLTQNVGVLGSSMHNRVMAEFNELLRMTIEGQAVELGWRASNTTELTSQDYLEMVALKTCAYTTIFPLRIGTLIGSWGRGDLSVVSEFGLYLGSAFQITDDVLNLTGSEELYGKEIDGDIAEGKRTLILIHLLSAVEGPEKEFLVGFLDGGRESRSGDDTETVRAMMDESGSIEYAREYARALAEKAASSFDDAFGALPDSPDRRFLSEVVDFVVSRNL
ncbi:MAG TPA: polyprenyl synthetase family protein [Acidimicrobiia bacterium]